MSEVVFEKGIVTFTFQVTIPADTLRAKFLTRHPQTLDALPDEAKPLLDDPQVLAEGVLQDLFRGIIEKARPQGVVVQIGTLDKEADAARIAPLRQKIESGELPGRLVTVRLGFTRDKGPFPGLSWLTSQVHEQPAEGITLLYTEAVQLPA